MTPPFVSTRAAARPRDSPDLSAERMDRVHLVRESNVVGYYTVPRRGFHNCARARNPKNHPKIRMNQVAAPFRPERLHCPPRRLPAEQIARQFLELTVAVFVL